MSPTRPARSRALKLASSALAVVALFYSGCQVASQAAAAAPARVVDFSGYNGGPVDDWLRSRQFTFQKDAKNRRLLHLSVVDDALRLEARGNLSGFLLNEIDVDKTTRVRVTWGITQYPADTSYHNKVNNEALMLYLFFGSEKVSSGHLLIPNSPYFIGLFLCHDEEVNTPYKGRYFHAGGRFVCLGKPTPGETVVSEFDFDTAFKSYFGKNRTPGISGIGFGVDTSKAGKGGAAGAFIKRIEFIGDAPGSFNADVTTFAATDTLAWGPLVTTMAYTWDTAGR